MTDRVSPFEGKRYEHEGDHVYFMSEHILKLIEAPMPTLLIGTRGTGKTTLLQALSWSERLDNKFLRKRLENAPFRSKYIGLYFKLPNVQLALLESWLRGSSDADYSAIFSFYLDLCWLETLAPALKNLSAAEVLSIEANPRLNAYFDQLLDRHPGLRELAPSAHSSALGVLDLVYPMRRLTERFARRGIEPGEVLAALPVGQTGSFGRELGKLIMDSLVTNGTDDDGGGWSLRICMDEGESLDLRQQRAINSMIRLAEWPVFYIVAYVSRPHDATGTLLPKQTLQVADRQIYVLDDQSDSEFRRLAEGIVNARLDAQSVVSPFRLESILGKLNINSLLLQILKSSENAWAQDLLAEAELARATSETAPIYETYLRRLNPEIHTGTTAKDRRKQASASIRKQMVAAYLSICAEVGAKPWYSSAEMVLQISDKCVRDFLRQMDFIYREVGGDLESFLKTAASDRTQDKGIKKAAELKMTLFRERVVSSPTEANRLVEGLARFTAELQGAGRNNEHLRSPERGYFTYLNRSGGQTQNEVLIRDAAEAGFLRLEATTDASEAIRFRVHASLAPQFGFSYRGAYYEASRLEDPEIDLLRAAATPAELSEVVRNLVRRTSTRPRRAHESPEVAGQLSLPKIEDAP